MNYVFKSKVKRFLTQLFDVAGQALFFAFKFSKKHAPQHPEKILVIRLDHIGDVVCSTPIFRELKEAYPLSEISVLTSASGKEILAENPYIRHVYVLEKNWFSRGKREGMLLGAIKAVFWMRREKFDIAFDLRGDIRHIMMMFLGRAKYRIGYGITGGGFLLNKTVEYSSLSHSLTNNLKLVSSLTRTLQQEDLELYLTEFEKQSASEILRSVGVKEDDKIVCIHAEAGYPSKDWGVHRFLELARKLSHIEQTKVVLLGTRKESLKEPGIENENMIDLRGNTALRELMALLSKADLFIGNDSGPSHIAAVLGVYCIVLASGTNNYEEWGIRTEEKFVFRVPVICAPCEKEECERNNHPCMNIDVDIVYKKAFNVLEARRGAVV